MSEKPAATPADVPSKAPESDPNAPAVPDADAPIEGEDALGDAGKKALATMRDERDAAIRALRAAETGGDAVNAAREAARELKELRRFKAEAEGRLSEFEAEQAAHEAAEEARSGALKEFRAKYLKAEIRGAAKGVLNDPEDAFRYLDLDEFEVSDDGEVDAAAITAALADLTAKKPYLSAQGGDKKQVLPDVSQGASTSGKATSAELFAAAVKDRI